MSEPHAIDAAQGIPVPRPDVRVTKQRSGNLAVSRRKFGRPGTAVLKLFRVTPDLTVKLDGLGSAVWRLLDGERTAAEVLAALQESHADEPQLPDRLGQYLSALVGHGLVELRSPTND